MDLQTSSEYIFKRGNLFSLLLSLATCLLGVRLIFLFVFLFFLFLLSILLLSGLRVINFV